MGDSLGEVLRIASGLNMAWYNQYHEIFYSSVGWILRAGDHNLGSQAGLFFSRSNNADNSDGTKTSRPVLVVSRNMPWLNNN